MQKAVIYARYSSHNQREQSIEDQINACKEYAQRNDIQIIRIYADYAQSGKKADRAQLQQMLKDSKFGEFQLVLVWKLDRFGRDREQIIFNRHGLKENGVKLISITEDFSDSKESVLIESLMEGLAEYYSLALAENVKRGMNSNAEKALVNGKPPEGYKIENKKFVIDETRAPIIREIFDLFVQGYSEKNICDILNNKGIKTLTGKEYYPQRIHKVLRNKRYMGVYIYADIIIPGGMPAIVDEETFNLANDILDSRCGKNMDNNYIFSNKIYCGLCGRRYVGESGTSKTGTLYHYYKCETNKSKKYHGNCPSKPIRRDFLQDTIIRVTLDRVLTDDVIESLSTRISELSKDDDGTLTVLNGQLQQKQKSLANLIASLEKGVSTDTIFNRIEQLDSEVSEIKAKIAREERSNSRVSKSEVAKFLGEIKKELSSDYVDVAVALNKLIDSIVIYPDKWVINYCSHPKDFDESPQSSCFSQLVNQEFLNSNIWLSGNSTFSMDVRI